MLLLLLPDGCLVVVAHTTQYRTGSLSLRIHQHIKGICSLGVVFAQHQMAAKKCFKIFISTGAKSFFGGGGFHSNRLIKHARHNPFARDFFWGYKERENRQKNNIGIEILTIFVSSNYSR